MLIIIDTIVQSNLRLERFRRIPDILFYLRGGYATSKAVIY